MIVQLIILGVIGLILGSFLNVVIYRLPRKESLILPGSHCPKCQNSIQAWNNVPLLSFLLLRGKCNHCGHSISFRYPLVEALTALTLIGLYLSYGWTVKMVAYQVMMLFLIPISFIDIDHGLILNKLTIPGFILGIGFILGFQIESWKSVLLGIFSGAGILLLFGFIGELLFKKESMGMGDVKLLVMIGAYVGFPAVLISLFFGVLTAALFILIGLSLKKIKLGQTIPFGPFIALGTLMFILRGQEICYWYINRFT